MTPTVDEAWNRILGWLTEYSPATLERIGPPAADADIAAVQAAVGVELPADLVAWWRRANGSASGWSHRLFNLVPIFRPCSIGHALDARQTWWQVWHDQTIERGWLAEEDFAKARGKPAGTEAGMWLPEFLPIASSGGGTDLFVDLRSGPMQGCVREFDKVCTDGGPRWADVTAMLADVADALENHSTLGGYHARLDGDEVLHWEYSDRKLR